MRVSTRTIVFIKVDKNEPSSRTIYYTTGSGNCMGRYSAAGCYTISGFGLMQPRDRSLAVAALLLAPRVCSYLQSRDRKGAVPVTDFPKNV